MQVCYWYKINKLAIVSNDYKPPMANWQICSVCGIEYLECISASGYKNGCGDVNCRNKKLSSNKRIKIE